MQAALHEHTRAAQFQGLSYLFVNRVEIEDVPLSSQLTLQWTIESAERAVLGAKVGVVNVAIDDVGNHAFRMQLAPHGIGFHADANQIIGAEHIESLLSGQGHLRML